MSVSRYDLLPPNATQLERDFSRATSSLVRTGPPVPLIRTAKRTNIPDSVVPWLIYEYGLGEILPFLGNNQRQALAEGVLWQRIRGTPESVRIALSWIGINGLIEESEGGSYRWAEYQLGLSAATTGEEIIDNIAGLARISSPVRSRLQRIYAVYDIRQLVWDEGRWDDTIWDDHSGVRLRPDWPQISYGQKHARYVSGDGGSVSSALTIGHGAHVLMIDHVRWDYSRWDEDIDTLNYSSRLTSSDERVQLVRYEGQTWTAISWRQYKPWPDVNAVASSSTTVFEPTSSASWASASFRASSAMEIQIARLASWAYANARASSVMSSEVSFPPPDLYLRFNGTNGSTTFTDSSLAARTVTAYGNAQISTAQSKSGGASGYFDGTGSHLRVADNAVFDFGAGNFTIEFWLYLPGPVARGKAILGKGSWPSGVSSFLIYWGDSTELSFYAADPSQSSWAIADAQIAFAPAVNQWHHIAVTRSGNTFRGFFNGVKGFELTYTGALADNGSDLTIASGASGGGSINAYIDELQITKGVANYIADFTPPA